MDNLTVLTDATNSNTKTSVEIAVLDQNVGAVCLHSNRVISIGDIPAAEGDVVCIYSVGTVSLVNDG